MDDDKTKDISDKVGEWEVPLSSGLYVVEFEHGTTTGKRIIRVNGKEVLRKEYMFKLVGSEDFVVDKSHCRIRIDPFGLFAYRYSLEVDGEPFRKFMERQSKVLKTWTIKASNGEKYRIVLEKDTLDIWVNGDKPEVENEFVDGGNKSSFLLGESLAVLHFLCTGIKKQPMIYSLTYEGEEIPESNDG